MAELRSGVVGRWPVAVLAAAGLAAIALGDVFAGWNSLAGRGSSAPGEYPIRIELPEHPPGPDAAVAAAADGSDKASAGNPADTGALAAATNEPLPGDVALAETARPALGPDAGGLLAVEFDLADAGALGSGGSAIEIRKAVHVNGAKAGDARIRVSGSSTLSFAREELGRLLAAAGQRELIGQAQSDGQFVSFAELRRLGIDVRYDPVSDRILVST